LGRLKGGKIMGKKRERIDSNTHALGRGDQHQGDIRKERGFETGGREKGNLSRRGTSDAGLGKKFPLGINCSYFWS